MAQEYNDCIFCNDAETRPEMNSKVVSAPDDRIQILSKNWHFRPSICRGCLLAALEGIEMIEEEKASAREKTGSDEETGSGENDGDSPDAEREAEPSERTTGTDVTLAKASVCSFCGVDRKKVPHMFCCGDLYIIYEGHPFLEEFMRVGNYTERVLLSGKKGKPQRRGDAFICSRCVEQAHALVENLEPTSPTALYLRVRPYKNPAPPALKERLSGWLRRFGK